MPLAVMREERQYGAGRAVEDREQAGPDVAAPAPTGRWAWEWIKSFLIAFALFLIIRTFLVEAFRIPTGSMEDTLLAGDFLLVNKAVFGASVPGLRSRLPAFTEPARGDIVVFVPPHEADKNYVKRLVGMPGDTLEMHNKTLYLNGRPLDEPFTRHTDPQDIYASGMFWQCNHAPAGAIGETCRPTRDNWGPLIVPAQRYFVLGDNRDDSEDSRYWGFVERDAVKGTPLFVYYSFDPSAARSMPWLTSIRCSHIGRRVH
jgi:signal peptidase I